MFTIAAKPSKRRHTEYDSTSSIGPMYCKAQSNHIETWTPFPLGLSSNVVKLLPPPSPTKSTTIAQSSLRRQHEPVGEEPEAQEVNSLITIASK